MDNKFKFKPGLILSNGSYRCKIISVNGGLYFISLDKNYKPLNEGKHFLNNWAIETFMRYYEPVHQKTPYEDENYKDLWV